MRKVSKNIHIPLHYQLKEILQEMIENEELKPGDSIPPERIICEIQGVSRMTVNKAIMSLVNEGLLYREQGKGTFVSKSKVKQQLSELKGFTKQMQDKGLSTSTKILSFKIKKATKKLKSTLQMQKNEYFVIEIERLLIIENEPFAIETVCIPKHFCEDLTCETIEGKSLYEILRNKYGYCIENAVQTIEPITLTEDQSTLLCQSKNSLALLFKRTAYIKNNIPIEYTKSIYRSDKYKYEVNLM